MKTTLSRCCPLAMVLLLAGGCAVPAVDIMPRYGTFDVEGNFGITNSPSGAVPVADMNVAGFGKDGGFLGLRADLDAGSPVFSLSTQITEHGGSGIVENTLTSGDGTILDGSMVDSEMSLGLHQMAVTFDMVPSDMIDVGLGFGVTVIDLDASMTDGFESLTTRKTLPMPVLALRGKVDLGDFEATGMISGMDVSVNGDSAFFLDLDLFAQYHLLGGDERVAGAIALGYRSTRLALDYEDNSDRIKADLRFSGPYVAIVVSF